MRLIKVIFSILFAIAGWASSAFALWNSYYNEKTSNRYWLFCAIIVGISALYIWVQTVDYLREKKKVFVHSTPEKVHSYLYKWIKDGGRTVVFTRDFTWANCNQEMLAMLQEKARRKELIVCLYRATDITDQLKTLGAEVYTHDLHDLKSRFTIIHYGTNCPQITVGSRNVQGAFVNERYDMQSNPNMYNIFVELFESAKATSINRIS